MYVYAVCDDVRENLQLEKEEEEENDFFFHFIRLCCCIE